MCSKTSNATGDKRLAFDLKLITLEAEAQRNFEQRRLYIINILLEEINECIINLKGNLRVFKALRKFYQFELLWEINTPSKISWLQDQKERIRDFAQQLTVICTITENLVRRAELLFEAGKRREDLVSSI